MADMRVSTTAPPLPMHQKNKRSGRLGYLTHYAVDGGKARVILNVLVTAAEVTGRFRLRGLEKVNPEALMIASGQNVKRLLAFGPRVPKKTAIVAALRPPGKPSLPPIRRHRTIPARHF